jgi:prevent-host-death family protein
MERTVTATELARRLSDVLNRVRYRGERFVVERNGEPVAVLAPAGPEAPPAPPTLRELVARLGDLALPGDGYAADLEAAQAAGQTAPEPPAWPS